MNESQEIAVVSHFRKSDSIASIAAALAQAQGKISGALKDSTNPFFKSKYADLASIWDACRQQLSEAGIAVMQFPRSTEAGIEVETLMAHSSGEWVSETLALPVAKYDAQGIGSAITYARRYALAAFVGVTPEDDDGNAAAESMKGREAPKQAPPKSNGPVLPSATELARIRDETLPALELAADDSVKALEVVWSKIGPIAQNACKNEITALKKRAKDAATVS